MDKVITIDDTINLKPTITYSKWMYNKSEEAKTFWLRQLDDFDNFISPEWEKTYEGSPQSEKTRELFKEFNEKFWAVSFKGFSSKEIVYLCACISPIKIGL